MRSCHPSNSIKVVRELDYDSGWYHLHTAYVCSYIWICLCDKERLSRMQISSFLVRSLLSVVNWLVWWDSWELQCTCVSVCYQRNIVWCDRRHKHSWHCSRISLHATKGPLSFPSSLLRIWHKILRLYYYIKYQSFMSYALSHHRLRGSAALL